jgi:cytoskeletal protein CcmA (bactofilin family)
LVNSCKDTPIFAGGGTFPDGDVCSSTTFTAGGESIFNGYIKANGEIFIGANSRVNGYITSTTAAITTDANNLVYGDINAAAAITIGAGSTIHGNLIAGKDITLGAGVTIIGTAQSGTGVITYGDGATVSGSGPNPPSEGACTNVAPPSFTSFPSDVLVCNQTTLTVGNTGFPTAHSDTTGLTIRFVDSTTNNFGPVKKIQRTYTATDKCNSVSRVQNIVTAKVTKTVCLSISTPNRCFSLLPATTFSNAQSACAAMGLQIAAINVLPDAFILLHFPLLDHIWVGNAPLSIPGTCKYIKPALSIIGFPEACTKSNQFLCEGDHIACT